MSLYITVYQNVNQNNSNKKTNTKDKGNKK